MTVLKILLYTWLGVALVYMYWATQLSVKGKVIKRSFSFWK